MVVPFAEIPLRGAPTGAFPPTEGRPPLVVSCVQASGAEAPRVRRSVEGKLKGVYPLGNGPERLLQLSLLLAPSIRAPSLRECSQVWKLVFLMGEVGGSLRRSFGRLWLVTL